MLETSDEGIDEISWTVGYEDPASFRCLFKRLTGLTPGGIGSCRRSVESHGAKVHNFVPTQRLDGAPQAGVASAFDKALRSET
jgi:AraC-like DNA-binding protein